MSDYTNGCAPDCQERVECDQVGELGHSSCGWCAAHDGPMHHCGCVYRTEPGR